MSGRICDKHQEWCPTGSCRWCEPPKAEAVPGPHEFGADGKCTACGQIECGRAFWSGVAAVLEMEPPPGASFVRLRPGFTAAAFGYCPPLSKEALAIASRDPEDIL